MTTPAATAPHPYRNEGHPGHTAVSGPQDREVALGAQPPAKSRSHARPGDGHSPDAPDVLFVVRGRHDPPTHPGVIHGLDRMTEDGTLRGASTIPVDLDDAIDRNAAYWRSIVDHVRERQTEFVVLHHYHSPRLPDPRPGIERLKSLPHRPLVALTNGDAWFEGFFRPKFPPMFLQAAEAADAVFSTSMGMLADQIVDRAAGRIALLPNGTCQARFGDPPRASPGRREFRVTFIGSSNRPRNPLRSSHWYSRHRERLVRRLSERFGTGFAVFGNGWHGVEGWQGPVPYEHQHAACQRADLVIGGVPFSRARYYMSDRTFNQIASGVPFVDLAVEGVETILRDGEHWHLATSIEQLLDRCDDLLTRPASEREAFGAAAAEYVLERHTEEARCRSLLRTLESLRRSLLEGTPPPPPDLDFLLPEVDRAVELPLATRGWAAG